MIHVKKYLFNGLLWLFLLACVNIYLANKLNHHHQDIISAAHNKSAQNDSILTPSSSFSQLNLTQGQ